MSLGSCRHLDKGKPFGATGEVICYQIRTDYFTIFAEEFEYFRFGYIIGQIANKEFQTASPGDCDRQESLSAAKMQVLCKKGDEKHHA